MAHRFVGTSGAGIIDTPFTFTVFAQLVEIPPGLLEHAVTNGIPVIPAAEFDKLGFTHAELSAFAEFENIPQAPPEFFQKLRQAWSALAEYRAAIGSAQLGKESHHGDVCQPEVSPSICAAAEHELPDRQ